jgi:hypothetical protein
MDRVHSKRILLVEDEAVVAMGERRVSESTEPRRHNALLRLPMCPSSF